jgi:hypothetical protein
MWTVPLGRKELFPARRCFLVVVVSLLTLLEPLCAVHTSKLYCKLCPITSLLPVPILCVLCVLNRYFTAWWVSYVLAGYMLADSVSMLPLHVTTSSAAFRLG